MKNPRRSLEIFLYKHKDKGIPNLMLYVCIGAALVYLFTLFSGNPILYYYLAFDRAMVLSGQVWRLITFPLVYGVGNPYPALILLSFFFFYNMARTVEQVWGTLRMNLFYLTGIVLIDAYCMIFGGMADATYLNLSIILAFSTLFPDAQFRILFIIPVKAWILALIDLALILFGAFTSVFPHNLFPVIALAHYFLFMGKDVLNLLPPAWRMNAARVFRKKPAQPKKTGTVPFQAVNQQPKTRTPYTHRCTVCGRTDVSDPELEFRYCSRCNGYFCYCEDHINNHTHVE